MSKIYDVIILGGGPAGLTAGLYAGRSRLSTLIIEKGQDGGQIAITDEIENYPGQMVEGESGPSLISRMTEQAKKFGAERCTDVIKSVELEGEVKKLTGLKGEYQAKCVIIATGAFPKPIGCENEGRFTGKGISFCATCDASFFEDFEVYVVGGGDSAVEEAMYLTKFARKVTIIHRRDELRAAKSIQEKAFANPKIAFMWDSVVVSVDGAELLSSMVVKNVKTGELTKVEADEDDGIFGLFGFIGYNPNSSLFEGMLDMEGFNKSLAEGLLLMTPFSAGAEDERTQSFVKKYQEAHGILPNQFAADGYDCMYAIYEACCQLDGIADMDSAALCDALSAKFGSGTFKVDGLTGKDMTWKKTGEIDKAPLIFKVENGAYVDAQYGNRTPRGLSDRSGSPLFFKPWQ